MNGEMKKRVAGLLLAAMTVSAVGGNVQDASLAAKKKLSVSLNLKRISVEKGSSRQLKAKKSMAKAKLSWKSSDKKVATVSAKGKVKGKKAGKATITVTAKWKKLKGTAKCKVTVTDTKSKQTNAPVVSATPTAAPTQAVTPSPTPRKTSRPASKPTATARIVKIAYKADYEIPLGETLDTKTKVTPKEGTIGDYTVSVSNDFVASVDESGVVQAKHIGKCQLILTSKSDETKTESYKLCVKEDFKAPKDYNVTDEDVPHGEVKDINYPSSYRTSGSGHAKIYLPPNYDEKKEYNLVFCLHGGNQDESFWTLGLPVGKGGCRAQIIMDNLLAVKEAQETIVVFPNGNIAYDKKKEYPNIEPRPLVQSNWSDCYLFEFEVVNDLLPYMQENYPVKKGADYTGVCGLSMGCGEAIEIGLNHPDLFHYMGFFSAGPFETGNQTFVTSKEDAQKLNEQVKLAFFVTGETDHMMDDSGRFFVNQCDEFGFNNMFYEVKGANHEDKCWDYGFYLFMKYSFRP